MSFDAACNLFSCQKSILLAAKENRKLQQALFSLTHATPLSPAPTLSTGECKVSGGESWVSGRGVGRPCRSHLPCSKPKTASLYFRWPSRDSSRAAIVEPPVSYLESTVPAAACKMIIVSGSVDCGPFAYRVLSPRLPSPSYAVSSLSPLS